jgi:hypothetical protein
MNLRVRKYFSILLCLTFLWSVLPTQWKHNCHVSALKVFVLSDNNIILKQASCKFCELDKKVPLESFQLIAPLSIAQIFILNSNNKPYYRAVWGLLVKNKAPPFLA